MRECKVRSIWQAGGTVVNGWLHIPSSYSAEVMAHRGWDSLTIDMQHGPIDYQVAVTMLQAISTTDVTPFVRVPWNEPGIIGKMLDAGAMGVICPMINSREECERFVGACKYPPRGFRSHGPNRTVLYNGSDYAANANDTVIAMAMIETKAAVENLDAILSVPGLDAIYLGPADLAQSYGRPPRADHQDAEMLGIIETVVRGCQRHGIYAGLHTGSPEYTVQMFDLGFQFSTILSDAAILGNAASAAVAAARKTGAASKSSGGPY